MFSGGVSGVKRQNDGRLVVTACPFDLQTSFSAAQSIPAVAGFGLVRHRGRASKWHAPQTWNLGMMLSIEHRILLECVEIWIRIRIRSGTGLDKFNRLPCFGQQRRPGREKETRGARSGHASMVNCVRVHHRLAFVNASSQRRG